MSKLTVVLDPGHKNSYNAGVVKGYYEGNTVWQIALYLQKELQKYKDVEVLLTKNRIGDNPSAYARGEYAARLTDRDKVVFLSLHTNAIQTNADKTYGTVVFRSLYKPDNQDLGQKLAVAVAEIMKAETKITYSRGCLAWESKTYPGYDYHSVTRGMVLNANNTAGAIKSAIDYGYIIEHAFHTNETECKVLMKDSVLQKLAAAETKVLVDYFKLKLIQTEPQPTPQPTKKIYRVQVGAFTNKANAEALQKQLAIKGFQGFIVEA